MSGDISSEVKVGDVIRDCDPRSGLRTGTVVEVCVPAASGREAPAVRVRWTTSGIHSRIRLDSIHDKPTRKSGYVRT